MRLVLDSDVLIAGLRSDQGASRRLLDLALDGGYDLLLSVPLVIEYESVLMRPDHLRAAGISSAEAGLILDALISVGEPVRLSFLWRPPLPDAKDDMVLETAVIGRADLLSLCNLLGMKGPFPWKPKSLLVLPVL